MVQPSYTATRIPAYETLAANNKGPGTEAMFGLMSDDTAPFAAKLDPVGVRCYGVRKDIRPVSKSAFPGIDYARIAEACGVQAATVRSVAELRALAPLLEIPERPMFIACKITAPVGAPFLLETSAHERRPH